MDDIAWYAEASLTSDSHVYCSGSLAQCVRRWVRLSEVEQAKATIKLGGRTDEGETLDARTVAGLAQKPELKNV